MSDVKVTIEQVKDIISKSVMEDFKIMDNTTVVGIKLPNGFVIIEASSCVDPDNYDHELGKAICMKRIEDKIWELEGYKLKCQMS